MKTIKIEIFNDKSYIRFYQYENLREENEQLKSQIEKMKCCKNCDHYETTEDYEVCRDKCVKIKNGQWILTNWELAE